MEATADDTSNAEQRRLEEERKHAQLIDQTKIMFANVADYLKAELQTTNEDFLLLEKMNSVTKEKYVEMASITTGLTSFMEDLQKKC
jgi:hypothetical protein